MSSLSQSNYILAALSQADYARLAPYLTPCLLHQGQGLYEKGDKIEQIYFPKTGIISLVLTSQNGVEVEVGLVGHEGALGSHWALAHEPMMVRANIQHAGSGWRLPADVLREECARSSVLQNAVLRAAYSLGHQAAQSVLCNRLHTVEKRLARWLLMCQDRMQTETLELTHEFIATMLGSRRVGVTLAAGALRDAKLIEYSRGLVTIINRPGLEAHACECYAEMRASLDSITPREIAHSNGFHPG